MNKDKAKGKLKEAEGKGQQAWGDTKEKSEDLWDDAKEKLSEKDEEEQAPRRQQTG